MQSETLDERYVVVPGTLAENVRILLVSFLDCDVSVDVFYLPASVNEKHRRSHRIRFLVQMKGETYVVMIHGVGHICQNEVE